MVKFDTEGRVALVLGRKPETMPVRPAAPRPGGGPGGAGPGPVRARDLAWVPGLAPVRARAGPGGAGQAAPPPLGSPVKARPGSSFNRPTDVAWDAAGNIYVADGIGANNRVAKFDKDGRFIKHWGSTGTEPGQFQGLKGLAIDAQGNVYVADAGNKRIQVFDADGTFKSQFARTSARRWRCA